MNTSELIYDWNKNHPPGLRPPGPVLLNDESLRDGLQSPSVRDPSIAEKIEILHLMEALGINALDLGLPISEVETDYRERPDGSLSKLSTIKDGLRILWLILHLVRDLLPLQFFSCVGAAFVIASIASGIPVILEFVATGLVPRLPTAVLSVGLMLVGIIAVFTGLILDSVAKGRREIKLLAYLSEPPFPGDTD